jgi:hypothetical protein
MIVGFSTGALAFGDFARALELLEPTGATAVELSALRYTELPRLLNALPSLLKKLNERYQYVSFHAPTDFQDEHHLVKQLAHVADFGLNIIVHPDTIRDASLWRELGNRLCLENMDSRKPTGRTVEELQSFFLDLPEAKLCFDIAHARQVDPSMTVAARILSALGDRMVQAHFSELNSIGKHFAMSYGAKHAYEIFADVLLQVPIILESVVGQTEITAEISKVHAILGLGHREAGNAAIGLQVT